MQDGRRYGTVTLMLLLTLAGAYGADLVLVRDGEPTATILVAKDALAYATGHDAVDLRDYLRAHTGAELPIVHEGRGAVATEAVINLGMTERARQAGIDVSALPGDCGVIKRIGNTLYIVGRDVEKEHTFAEPGHKPNVRRLMGTKRTLVAFLRDTLGYRFFFPGTGGTYFPPTRTIAVGDLDITTPPPRLRFGQGGGLAGTGYIPYRTNLGGMNQDLVEYHGGHSFYAWVPSSLYFEEHPDWFRMEKGIRTGKSNHICPTSAELKRHIVSCMEKIADNGFTMMENYYADGWLWCECPRCLAAMEALGLPEDREGAKELMKVFMRDTCLALEQSRPGAGVMVLAYGPLAQPPTTFESYPDNVMLQLASSRPEAADDWAGVAKTFAAYTYQWTFASPRAQTGQSNLYDMADDAREYLARGYRMIYFCGSPANRPIESPAAYVTGRILQDPEASAEDLLREMCDKMFGPAAAPMFAFYSRAHRRIQTGDRVARKSGIELDQYLPYRIQWPSAELDLLRVYLDRARSLADSDKSRLLLDWIQDGFDFIDATARLVQVYDGYLADPDAQKLEHVEQMVQRREAVIDRILENNKAKYKPLAPVFKIGLTREQILMGGQGSSTQLRSPLTWDFEVFRRDEFLPGKSRPELTAIRVAAAPVIDGQPDDEAWDAAASAPIRFVSGGAPAVPASVSAVYDASNLYVRIVAEEPLIDRLETQPYGRDGGIYGNECCEIFLDPEALGLLAYHFIAGPQEGGLLDEKLFDAGARSERAWDGRVAWGFHRDLERKRWSVEMAVPFEELGTPCPTEGEFWLANFTRTTRPYAFGLPREAMPERFLRKHNSWSPILGVTKYADPKGMGILRFGATPR